jgi:hypothetical protein
MGNSQRQLDALPKKLQALELRKAGLSYDAIAQEMGYKTKVGAYNAVMAALKKTLQEPADDLRKVEVARLDELLMTMWEKRHLPLYTDRIIKIMERRAKLLGLDAPDKHEVEISDVILISLDA